VESGQSETKGQGGVSLTEREGLRGIIVVTTTKCVRTSISLLPVLPLTGDSRQLARAKVSRDYPVARYRFQLVFQCFMRGNEPRTESVESRKARLTAGSRCGRRLRRKSCPLAFRLVRRELIIYITPSLHPCLCTAHRGKAHGVYPETVRRLVRGTSASRGWTHGSLPGMSCRSSPRRAPVPSVSLG
jgi:hypothetical protein